MEREHSTCQDKAHTNAAPMTTDKHSVGAQQQQLLILIAAAID